MAAKWSNEYVVAEHKDLQASTMAVDSTGQYALLAGRRCLAVVDIYHPTVVIKKVPRQSKWEVGASQWNPHSQCAHLCAISSNQRTEILSWSQKDLTTVHSLRSHTRAVSDLHWHCFEPTILATCSVDTFINIWDLRDPRKPSVSLSAVVGATQVRWNRVSGHLLATAHEGDVRLWDSRKGSAPVQYIAAHLQKIHGLDWSMTQDNQLATSSQDCTVKFFDVNNPRSVENTLRTICPVWRARYTPFGEGMVTVVVPQLRRGENSLLLWSLSDLTNPVHTFIGHTDVVLEFDWKRNRQDDDDYQLVTWSKDQSLRIWRVDTNLQKLCGYEPDNEPPTVFGENDSTIKVSTIGTVSPSGVKDVETGLEVDEETMMVPPILLPETLRLPSNVKGVAASIAAAQAVLSNTVLSPTTHRKKVAGSNGSLNGDGSPSPIAENSYSFTDELEQIKSNANGDTITLSDIDESQRSFTATLRTSKHQVILHVSLPSAYPVGVLPNFHFGKGTTLDSSLGKSKIYKVLKQTSQNCAKKNSPCLDTCFQQLLSSIDQLAISDKSEPESSKTLNLTVATSSGGSSSSYRLPQSNHAHLSFLQSNPLFAAHNQDYNIPYARTSGARFCSAGMLVCFGRPSYLRRVSNKTSDSSTTPRALSSAQPYATNLGLPHTLTGSSNAAPFGLLYPPVAQSPTGDPSVSISSFYSQDRRQKPRHQSKSKNRLSSVTSSSSNDGEKRAGNEVRQHKVGVVTIYDASGLMPLQRELAERYVFNDADVPWMCTQNAAVASLCGRKDLAHIWSLASLLAIPSLSGDGSHKDLETPWAQNPFGRKLLQAIIDHYVKQGDIQTVAMLCCAFGFKSDSQNLMKRKNHSNSGSPGESPYHTIHPGDTSLDGWNVTGLKQNRSNSWSESLDDFRLALSNHGSNAPSNMPLAMSSIFCPPNAINNTTSNGSDSHDEPRDRDYRLLDSKMNPLYDNFRRCYADILYRWGLLKSRVLVLKYLSVPPDPHRGVDFVTECSPCRTTVRGPQCALCKRLCMHCVICRVAVKGSASFCLICGHGGHSLHMAHWFAEESVCPTGCGCNCLLENASVFAP